MTISLRIARRVAKWARLPTQRVGRPAHSSSPVVRCASAGSYSLRSTIGARSPRHRTAAPIRPLLRRRRPLRFHRLLLASLDNRCSLATAPHCGADSAPSSSPVVRCASAGSSSLRSAIGARHGTADSAPSSSPVVRCASAGSYSLRSTIGARSPRHRTAAPTRPLLRRRSSAALPPAPPRFAPQSVLGTAPPIRPLLRRRSSAALPPAPTRFARQSVLARHGTALRRHPATTSVLEERDRPEPALEVV